MKAALLLPIILAIQYKVPQPEENSIDLITQLNEKKSTIRTLNVIWYVACFLSIIVSIIAAFLYGEKNGDNKFWGHVLIDSMFIMMCLYFVIIFILSMKKIRETLKRTKYAKNFVNEKEMKAQLLVFIGFFAAYLINHCL